MSLAGKRRNKVLRRRGRKSRRTDVYTSNLSKMSVYPRFNRYDDRKSQEIKEGDVIKVRIIGIDDSGRGIAYYKNVKVLVEDAIPGSEVVCKVVRVSGNLAYAKPLRT